MNIEKAATSAAALSTRHRTLSKFRLSAVAAAAATMLAATGCATATQSGQTPAGFKSTDNPATGDYSGNGIRTIGTIVVPKDSTLYWTDKPYNGQSAILISAQRTGDTAPMWVMSEATSGQSFMQAGTYTDAGVLAGGDWHFRIVPNG